VKPLRFGVAGCGVIAYWTHLRELPKVPGVNLMAAADPDPAARERAIRLAHVPVYERLEEMLSREAIDAVVICAPTHLHASLAITAAEAGKHVYVEKPFAASGAEARSVSEAAKSAGVCAAVGFNRRHHPVYEQARDLIRTGRIGKVQAILSALCEPLGSSMPEWKRRRATGGGVLLDLASHHIDLIRWFLCCEVDGVEAGVASRSSEDDEAWLQMRTNAGAHVTSYFSFNDGRTDFMQFIGEHGTLCVDRHRPGLTVRVARRFGYGVRNVFVVPTRDVLALRLKRTFRPSYESSYRRALEAFAAMVRGAASSTATLEDGMRCMNVILAAEASARLRPALENAVSADT
jgi:predicted dehydrogenase